jgi:pimeloyl-ACP methyl ester carboxylesterase
MDDNIRKIIEEVYKPQKGKYRLFRGGQPSEKAFFKASKSSYQNKAFDNIEGYNKIYDGKTIDAFLNPQSREILVGVRGTAMSLDDLKADANIVGNNLKNSTRYINDVKQMNEIFQNYPPNNFNYYLGGHSLGSAIIAQLKRDYPFLKDAVVFNGALQPVDISNQPPDMKFKYIDKDILYNIVGKSVKNKEVFPYEELKRGSFFGRIGAKLQPTALKAHKLEQFESRYGGKRKGKGIVQSAARKVSRGLDNEEARQLGNNLIMEAMTREVNDVNKYYLIDMAEDFMDKLEDIAEYDVDKANEFLDRYSALLNPYTARFGFIIGVQDVPPPPAQAEAEPEEQPNRFVLMNPDGTAFVAEDREEPAQGVGYVEAPPPREGEEKDPYGYRRRQGKGKTFSRTARVEPTKRELEMERMIEETSRAREAREAREREDVERELKPFRDISARAKERARKSKEKEEREAETERTARMLKRRGYSEEYYKKYSGRGAVKDAFAYIDNIIREVRKSVGKAMISSLI